MLKQEVASFSARVALLESQKRDLELANQDLAELLADLATNTTNDKNNNFVNSVLPSDFKMRFYTRFSKLSFNSCC